MLEFLSLDLFSLPNLCIFGFLLSSIAVSSLFTLSYATPWVRRRRSEYLKPEKVYRSSPEQTFPKLLAEDSGKSHKRHTNGEIYLSVIIPAMNEKERLPIMLDECCKYLQSRSKSSQDFTYEIIIVDDGSSDGTADLGVTYGLQYPKTIKVLKLEQNRGKGGAVKAGVLNCAGKLILFADADGATQFEDFENLEKEIIRSTGGSSSKEIDESFPAVVVGSRAHLEAQSVAERSFFRTILMHGFHSLVYLFAVRSVKDTQCGFKLFTRAIAARLFPVLHVERWAFDVELLYLCEKWRVPVGEVCVRWKEIDGSKITPIWSWLQMGRDLVLIWFRYTVGIWSDEQPK
ncbi:unnamed protein product [Caenorhabditis angaria]|uniref:dolichyl-phosphate beta-glucosyltransferase n=1 Tax=Caenorhabditis angaria TaxID=860376 RepID=A0A9P1IZ44_9PELO|nr:unnamed protein product [Caenorhabditis angaria]